ncbi:MAG: DUF4491 family protein [Prevotellamassilia sp.]|jgi:uncharacterized membrane protein YuzA (DUF378 family)|nr:DUF4491 family protein [Prevotellamassilia sp.]
MTLTGVIIGLATFLIIGAFHPVVIKTEYYFGVRPWWVFLIVGIGCIVGALFIKSLLVSAIVGVTGFSALWSILELFEQRERVNKGWFPEGPGHERKQVKG